jgi:hypothetical protein
LSPKRPNGQAIMRSARLEIVGTLGPCARQQAVESRAYRSVPQALLSENEATLGRYRIKGRSARTMRTQNARLNLTRKRGQPGRIGASYPAKSHGYPAGPP